MILNNIIITNSKNNTTKIDSSLILYLIQIVATIINNTQTRANKKYK